MTKQRESKNTEPRREEVDRYFAQFMTTNEVCAYLHITSMTLQRWRKAGKVSGTRAGRYWLYRKEDIEALLKDRK